MKGTIEATAKTLIWAIVILSILAVLNPLWEYVVDPFLDALDSGDTHAQVLAVAILFGIVVVFGAALASEVI